MRKNKIFAVVLAGMLTAGLAGCGNHTQTAGKESSITMQAMKMAEVLQAAENSIAVAAEESAPAGAEPEAADDSVTEPVQTEEEKPPEGAEKENPAATPPVQDEQPVQSETSNQKVLEETAESQPAPPAPVRTDVPAPAEPPAPEPVGTEPSVPRSIYDYEFDIEAIRQELIALGEGMGLTHITTDDGRTVTPDTAFWATPVTASESFQGVNLERKLKDYVRSMPGIITAYGGNPITLFTIYTEPLGGGSYRIYFLY